MSEEEHDPNEMFQLTPEGFEALHAGELDHFEDEQLIILRLIDGKEARELPAPTAAEITAVVQWYREVMLSLSLTDMVLEGDVYVDLDEGEPMFTISSKGKKKAGMYGFLPENN